MNANLADYVEAERYYRRAMATWIRLRGPSHPNVADSLEDLGDLRRLTGQDSEAIELLERALTGSRKPRSDQTRWTSPRLSPSWRRRCLIPATFYERMSVRREPADMWQRSGAQESARFVEALSLQAAIQARMGEHALAGRRTKRR